MPELSFFPVRGQYGSLFDCNCGTDIFALESSGGTTCFRRSESGAVKFRKEEE